MDDVICTEQLSPDPKSASLARAAVARALGEGCDTDLVETATLLVSEIVTNAIIHAGTEISLRISADARLVRAEVEDESTSIPAVRGYDNEAFTGRGLEMVELLSTRWGIKARPNGKIVWFELGRMGPHSDDEISQPETSGLQNPVDALLPVTLVGLPVQLTWATLQYGDALLRDCALLALGGGSSANAFPDWHPPGLDLTALTRSVKTSLQAGERETAAHLEFPIVAGDAALHRLSLLNEANRLAAEGRLLLPAALPEIAACRNWIFGEIALQLQGAPGTPWTMPAPVVSPSPILLGPDEQSALVELGASVMAADSGNRIIYVTDDAASLLGWTPEELVGQRLTAIVPKHLREAHLAGFTRYQVTGEARLLGREAHVPALRRDGSELSINITIRRLGERTPALFAAVITAAE